jgi:undecaprenyl-diphosphatase
VLNQRFLEQAGIGRTSALAAISLKVIAGALTRIGIMVLIAVLVGASGGFDFDASAWPYLVCGLLVLVVAAVIARLAFPAVATRAKASMETAVRDMAAAFRQPGRVATLFASSLLLPLTYGLALWASAMAFSAEVPVIDLLAVYLAGTAVAAASPTPGNIGAVEVALPAGLTTIGVPSAAAVAAVLVYRLLTFWLPLVPGLFAFRYLQAQGRI